MKECFTVLGAQAKAKPWKGMAGLLEEGDEVAALLSKSLAEEEIADSLLTQIARELMSEARTGATKEPKRATALKVVDG